MATITSIAFEVRRAAASLSTPIILGHAQQLLAAALGYASLYHYQHSENEPVELDPRGHYVLHTLLGNRLQELQSVHKTDTLVSMIKTAFNASLPQARVHSSDSEFAIYLRELIEARVAADIDVKLFIDLSERDWSTEITFDLEGIAMADLSHSGIKMEKEIKVRISVDPEADRPDSGRTMDVEVVLYLERKGLACLAEPICDIVSAEPNYDSGRARHGMYSDPSEVSLAQALAEYLHLEIDEAEKLTDAEVESNESNDGLVYNYFYDFTSYASAGVAQKIRAQHGGLRIELPPSFFDRVRRPIE